MDRYLRRDLLPKCDAMEFLSVVPVSDSSIHLRFAQGRRKGELPNLVGIVVSKNDEKAIGGFQSIHKAVETIRRSILKGEGLRLVNEKRFW